LPCTGDQHGWKCRYGPAYGVRQKARNIAHLTCSPECFSQI
jgi:hypothetical protein